MLNDEQRSGEVLDQEFEEQRRRLDQLDRRRLKGKRYANVIPALNARDVVGQLSHFDGDWIFRGQKDVSWGLEPSIERCASKGFWNPKESKAYQEFRDRALAYKRDLPKLPNSDLAWLATMQHYGGPTRLLDWTEDPNVAAFFAVFDADRRTASAVWAINHTAITKESERLLSLAHRASDDNQHFGSTFFRATWPPVVMHVNTSWPSKRQKKQKGLFLCSNQTQWEYSFETCLKNVLERRPKGERRWLCKITIPPDARDDLLADLTERGVTYESLFPDLGGLGRSLKIIASIQPDYITDCYPES